MKFSVPDRAIVRQLAAQTGVKRIRFVAGCEFCGVICTLGREGVPDMSCHCCERNGLRTVGGSKYRRPNDQPHRRIPIDVIAAKCA